MFLYGINNQLKHLIGKIVFEILKLFYNQKMHKNALETIIKIWIKEVLNEEKYYFHIKDLTLYNINSLEMNIWHYNQSITTSI